MRVLAGLGPRGGLQRGVDVGKLDGSPRFGTGLGPFAIDGQVLSPVLLGDMDAVKVLHSLAYIERLRQSGPQHVLTFDLCLI